MADSNFDTEKFLRELAERTGIYTGAPQIQDKDVPVNVDPNQWRLEQLNQQLAQVQNAPENLAETQRYLPGGQYNPTPVAEQPRGVLAGATNKPSVPIAPVADSPLASVKSPNVAPQVTLSEGIDQEQANAAASPSEEEPIEEFVKEEDEMSETKLNKSLQSLTDMFKEHMSKVQKVEYNKMDAGQKRDVALRFFLRLMEEGGKKGSGSVATNIGIAGRHALDAKRVIENQNNQNELERFNREHKQVFDTLTLEARDRSNQISARRWDLAAKAAADKIKAGEWTAKKSGGHWVLINSKTGESKPVLDKNGNKVKADTTTGGIGSQAQLIEYLQAGGDKEKAKKRMGTYKEIQAAQRSPKTSKDETHKRKQARNKAITEMVKNSGDEFGQGKLTREEAGKIYDQEIGDVQASSPAPTAPAKTTGDAVLQKSKLTPEQQREAQNIKFQVRSGQMTKEKGLEKLRALGLK